MYTTGDECVLSNDLADMTNAELVKNTVNSNESKPEVYHKLCKQTAWRTSDSRKYTRARDSRKKNREAGADRIINPNYIAQLRRRHAYINTIQNTAAALRKNSHAKVPPWRSRGQEDKRGRKKSRHGIRLHSYFCAYAT